MVHAPSGQPVNCPLCNKTCKRLINLREHLRTAHGNGKTDTICDKCGGYCLSS